MAISKIIKESWEEIPLAVNVTTGDMATGYIKAYQKGDLLMFDVNNLNRAASTSAGGNMFGANISGLPKAFFDTSVPIYYDASLIVIYFKSTGDNTATVNARVLAATLPSNSPTGKTSVITRFI